MRYSLFQTLPPVDGRFRAVVPLARAAVPHDGLNIRRGFSKQDEVLNLAADRAPKLLHGQVLVTATGQEHDGVRKGLQGRHRPCWRSGDGVIVVPHTLPLSHQLQPVLEALKGAHNLRHRPGDSPGRHRDNAGGQDVRQIMTAQQLDILNGTDALLDTLDANEDLTVLHKGALSRFGHLAETEDLATAEGRHSASAGIILGQHGDVKVPLVAEDVALSLNVGRHGGMPIEMIRGHVEYHRQVRADSLPASGPTARLQPMVKWGKSLQLEARQLHDHGVVGPNGFQMLDQRATDVAPDPGLIARGLQHLAHQRGRCRLAAGTGDPDDWCRAELEKETGLTYDRHVPTACFDQNRRLGRNARAGEDDVCVQKVRRMSAEHKADRQALQRCYRLL